MLRIYPVILTTLRALRPAIEQIERHDADLARQMRKAATSVVLNTGEGMYSRKGLRAARYHVALGSMRETLSALEAAEALGYIARVDGALLGQINHVIGTFVRLLRLGR